jgi:hypothetical protein
MNLFIRSVLKICSILLCFGFLISSPAGAQTKLQTKTNAKPTGSMARIPPPGPAELPFLPAQEFASSRGDLELSLPAGWTAIEAPHNAKSDASLVLLDGPGSPGPSCRVVSRVPKQPPKITQAQINKIMHDDRNVQMVRKNLSQSGHEIQSIAKINSHGINGLQAKLLIAGTEHSPDSITLISFFEVVGQSYSFECNVLSADYDNISNDFDVILKSARLTKS